MAELPDRWSETENIRWKTAIHGKGWSSPVIWHDKIWLTTADPAGHKLSVVCVDRGSGKIIHDRVLFEVEKPEFCHPTNSYASCTAALEDGRVYVHFGSVGTACLDSNTAQTIWQRRDLPCDHFRGPASSPILDGDLLFINFDGVDAQYVTALEKSTGKTRWKKDRTTDFGDAIGDLRKAYATPSIIVDNGRRLLVSSGAVGSIAYEAGTGKEVWRVRHGGMNAANRPFAAEGLIFLNAGAEKNSLVALKEGSVGDIPESAFAWRSGQGVPQRAGPIAYNGFVFMVNDAGVVSCLDVKTGDPKFRERLKKGTFWASPLIADGKLYCFAQEGVTYVVAAKPEFQNIAANTLDEGCNATPAVAGNALFLRTKTHLYRIEKTPATASKRP